MIAAVIVFSSGAVYGVVHFSGKGPSVPTFQVQRGEFLDAAQFRGQLKAMKSVTITAPANAGDLQILKIAADGTQVKKGDIVVQFDPSKTQQDLAQDQSILKSSQAEIEQVHAQGGLTEEADTTALMKAKYDVEVAKLEASKSEVVSRIDGAEAKLKLADAEQALRQAEAQLKSDIAVGQATVEDKKHASRKADFDAQRAGTALAAMTLRAPSDGSISLLSVWHNGGEAPSKQASAHGRERRSLNCLTQPRCALQLAWTRRSAAVLPRRSRSRFSWMQSPTASLQARWSGLAQSPLRTFRMAGRYLGTSTLRSVLTRRTRA